MRIAKTAVSVGALLLISVPYLAGAADSPASPVPAAIGGVTSPLWFQLIDAAQKLATILGIILGGIAAYYKFLKGRVFHSRLDIAMSSSFLRIGEDGFLQVQGHVKNTGASHIRFVLKDCVLIVSGANHAHRDIADDALWTRIAVLDGVPRETHKWIEPAETIYLNWLVDLPGNLNYAALKSELWLSTRKIVWRADTIATIKQIAHDEDPTAAQTSGPRQHRSGWTLRHLFASALRCMSTRTPRS